MANHSTKGAVSDPSEQNEGHFGLSPDVQELCHAAERFAQRELVGSERAAEAAGRWGDGVRAVLRDFSLGRLDLPERLHGEGMGLLAKVALLETLAAADSAGLPAADQPGMAAGALLACPDHRLVAEISDACADGEAQCALVVHDPESSTAHRIEWAPSWPPRRWVFVTEGDALSLYEVRPGAGHEDTVALAFQASGGTSADLDPADLVGTWPLEAGDGFTVRGRARLWLAAVAVGVAQTAFEATVAYTTERIVFGKPVAHHQGNAFELAGAACNLHAARLAVRDAAARFDEGDPHAGFWATQAWLEAVPAAVVVTDLGIQLLGGHGFLVDHLAEKRFREARMLGMLAGGHDLAQDDVAAQVLDVPDRMDLTSVGQS